MIRQAHTYLVGAMGGAMLIAIAIAVFVLLVSAQVFRDWPIAALGDGGDDAAVSEAQQAAPAVGGAAAGPGAGGGAAAGANDGRQTRAGLPENGGSVAAGGGIGSATGGRNATEPGGSGGGDGGDGANGSPQTTNASNPAGGGGSASSGGGGKSSGGSGSTTSSPSSQVTGTVNNTVNQVDETALGGTLDNSGVTEATEGVVNGVAGPESAVGKVVDDAVGAVGGLLGDKP